MQDLAINIDEARLYLKAGGVGVAEMILRQLLEKNPADAGALRMLAGIARAMGESWWAGEFERRGGVQTGTTGGESALPPAPSLGEGEPERYLLIKAWGNGFCSDLDHTLGHLLLAELTGRVPVIHWGRNSLFGVDSERDAFAQFFEPVSSVTIDDLVGKGHDYFPPKWSDANLRRENVNKIAGPWSRLPPLVYFGRPERVAVADVYAGVINLACWLRPEHPMFGRPLQEVYRYLIGKYLRLRPEIQREIDEFKAAAFAQRPIIAAHVRGSDKHREDPQLAQKNAVFPQVISQFSAGLWFPRVFLLTDSVQVREEYAGRYGEGLITTECTRSATDEGVHLQKQPDRYRIGVEVIKDVWLAKECDYFVGLGSSNVTCMIYHMKPWTRANCGIVGPLMTHMPNPYLYMTHEQLARYLPPAMMEKLRERERAERSV